VAVPHDASPPGTATARLWLDAAPTGSTLASTPPEAARARDIDADDRGSAVAFRPLVRSLGENVGVQPGAAMIRGGVIAAIVLAVLGAASATPWVVTVPPFTIGNRDRPVPTTTPMTLPPQEPPQRDLPVAETLEKAMLALFTVIVVALAALAIGWLVRRLRAAWRPEEDLTEPDRLDGSDVPGEVVGVDITSLATAVARAEAHLAGTRQPRDAVIAAWVALEDEAELQGAGRDPAQTATEFTTELLARTSAPADAVAVLRGLYHRARFTSGPVTPQDVGSARGALARIASALDVVQDSHREEASS
jgi:hypothetical protein